MRIYSIQYCFRLSKERQEIFNLKLDGENLELVGDFSNNLPDWTRLGFHQCPNCTLDVETHPYCPAASHLAEIVKRFADILSCDEIHLDVVTEDRHISQDTSAQLGIASLLGLIMATSGCPHLAFFKPMARFHLTIANEYETVFRSVSTYLLGQYFVAKAGAKADLELKGLRAIYKNVKMINACMLDRLRTATEKDSSLNAVITLHLFAEAVLSNIEESLEGFRHLFVPYLKKL